MKKIIYLLSSALCGLVIASCGDSQKAGSGGKPCVLRIDFL